MQAIQNLGLAVIAIAAGAIVDSSGYLILEVFFLACLCGTFTTWSCLSNIFIHGYLLNFVPFAPTFIGRFQSSKSQILGNWIWKHSLDMVKSNFSSWRVFLRVFLHIFGLRCTGLQQLIFVIKKSFSHAKKSLFTVFVMSKLTCINTVYNISLWNSHFRNKSLSANWKFNSM